MLSMSFTLVRGTYIIVSWRCILVSTPKLLVSLTYIMVSMACTLVSATYIVVSRRCILVSTPKLLVSYGKLLHVWKLSITLFYNDYFSEHTSRTLHTYRNHYYTILLNVSEVQYILVRIRKCLVSRALFLVSRQYNLVSETSLLVSNSSALLSCKLVVHILQLPVTLISIHKFIELNKNYS